METALRLIFSTGHSGTTWFSKTFSRPEKKTICIHREAQFALMETGQLLKKVNYGAMSLRLSVFESQLEACDFMDAVSYRRLWDFAKQSDYRTVGYDLWPPDILPNISPVLEPLGIQAMLWMRHGVQVIESMYYHSTQGDMLGWYHNFMRYFRGPYLLKKYWDEEKELELFEALCIYWAACAKVLQDEQTCKSLYVLKFEDVLNDLQVFKETWNWFAGAVEMSEDEIAAHQKNIVNSKNKKSNDVQDIWKRWSSEQKTCFEHYCSDAMKVFQYEV